MITRDAIGNVVSTVRFRIEITVILRAIKTHLKRHVINRILRSWSFHMKFMKLAKGSFHKYHIK